MAKLSHILPTKLKYSPYAEYLCIWSSDMSIQAVHPKLKDNVTKINDFLKSKGIILFHEQTVVLPFRWKCLKKFKLQIDSQRLQLL